MTSIGNCRLCDLHCELQNSHVLPAFIIRWIRRTSATGHIRFAHTPNLRIQDGAKRHWLCKSCENVLSKCETQFANRVFNPIVEGDGNIYPCGPWLLKFCVSISWRVLMFHREMDSFDDYSEANLDSLGRAEFVWKEFLRGNRSNRDPFSQHLFISRKGMQAEEGMAANINHYIFRTTDMDVVLSPVKPLVYAKIPAIFILGIVDEGQASDWHGTKVTANGTAIPPKQHMSEDFCRFANFRARRTFERAASVSERQRAKIIAALKGDLD